MLGWRMGAAVGALVLPIAAAQAQNTLTPAQTVQLAQSALTVLGQDPGPIDGALGPRTRAAVTAYVDAAGLEMGWNGRTLDQSQAMSLSVAAKPALEQLFGHALDGNYSFVGAAPLSEGSAGVAAAVGDVSAPPCSAAPRLVGRIDGLMVWEPEDWRDPADQPTIVVAAPPVLQPLPRTGTWHAEAEPWTLTVVSGDVIAFEQEGDAYVLVRCVP